ncbi:hypothetical protein CDAR_606831 [Caerostris darwini]|uniref:Endonuclease/exonuclease/phosphatase domain-containing protein n=1 Tax=Caerostris darwini TaxID=1538125 RepID=A0AAV4R0X9_9ARAC|nr:hypothetical protein CDAR_606831 [Caerostris darwini]
MLIPHNSLGIVFRNADDLEIIMQLGSNIIMCCDFNAHHHVWNCSNNRPRGTQLLKFVNQTDLNMIASTTPTTFGFNSSSTTDLL